MGDHTKSRVSRRTGRVAVIAVLVTALAGGAVAWVSRPTAPAETPVVARCADRPIVLTVGADPSAMSWMQPLMDGYSAARRTIDGRCVKAKLGPLDPRQITTSSLRDAGRAVPDVWIPESRVAVDLVRLRLPPEVAKTFTVREPSIASTPVVLALPPEAVQVLAAQPRGSGPQFAALLKLAGDPSGWGRLGRKDWGPVRFTTVDPGTTMLGTSLVVAAVGALTGTQPRDLRAAAFTKVDARGGLLAFARNLVSSSPSSAALFDEAARLPASELLRRMGILAVYEKDLWQYNAAAPKPRLRAVYPFGGQLAADFPLVVPKAEVSGPTARATADLDDWLMSEPAQRTLAGAGLRRADGRADPALAAAFGLEPRPVPPERPAFADGTAAAQSNWRLINRPLSILAMMDVSGSMAAVVGGTTQTKLDLARAAAATSLGFLSGQDAIGLWEFSRDLGGGRDYRQLIALGPADQRVGAFPDRRSAAAAAYRGMAPRTGTGLHDSVLAGYRSAAASYQPGAVNALLVLTDGRNEDPGSISLDRLIADLTASYEPRRPVHIITLAYGADADRAVLGRMVRATAGLEFAAVDPRTITDVFIAAMSALAG